MVIPPGSTLDNARIDVAPDDSLGVSPEHPGRMHAEHGALRRQRVAQLRMKLHHPAAAPGTCPALSAARLPDAPQDHEDIVQFRLGCHDARLLANYGMGKVPEARQANRQRIPLADVPLPRCGLRHVPGHGVADLALVVPGVAAQNRGSVPGCDS